jgi:bifunctional non-homologous end joining protein LigD
MARLFKLAHFRNKSRSKKMAPLYEAEITGNSTEIRPYMPLQPMPLQTRRLPFDDPNWVFELKCDGVRALAIADRRRELLSRNGHPFGSFADLAKQIAEHLPDDTVIDGEIVAVDRRAKPRFNDLLFHRRPPCFFAFDLLRCEGMDWRTHQLLEGKQELRRLLARVPVDCPVRYVDHV